MTDFYPTGKRRRIANGTLVTMMMSDEIWWGVVVGKDIITAEDTWRDPTTLPIYLVHWFNNDRVGAPSYTILRVAKEKGGTRVGGGV